MKYLKKEFDGMVPYHSELITDGIILNANESPVKPPKEVLDKINKALANIEFNRYPDMDERELDKAIAKHYGIEPYNVTVGVGSDELLDVCFRAVLNKGDNVIGFSPSFSMYKEFANLVGANYISIEANENNLFQVDEMIENINKYNPKMVLICSPNNPTGQFFSKEEIIKVIKSTDALIILDLAYIDFAKEDYFYLGLEYENVIAFKTFSKALALPSIRVGYAMSNKDNIDMINTIKAPYSVTTISQIIAKIAIENFNLYSGQIKQIINERDRLYKELKNMNFNVYKSEANFLYILMPDKYNDALLKKKIYIRKFKSGVYRITVGTKYENDLLLEVLKDEN